MQWRRLNGLSCLVSIRNGEGNERRLHCSTGTLHILECLFSEVGCVVFLPPSNSLFPVCTVSFHFTSKGFSIHKLGCVVQKRLRSYAATLLITFFSTSQTLDGLVHLTLHIKYEMKLPGCFPHLSRSHSIRQRRAAGILLFIATREKTNFQSREGMVATDRRRGILRGGEMVETKQAYLSTMSDCRTVIISNDSIAFGPSTANMFLFPNVSAKYQSKR